MIEKPAWLDRLRAVGPAPAELCEQTMLPPGSWIVRHSISSRDLDPLTRRGHKMVSLDESHTLVAPAIHLL